MTAWLVLVVLASAGDGATVPAGPPGAQDELPAPPPPPPGPTPPPVVTATPAPNEPAPPAAVAPVVPPPPDARGATIAEEQQRQKRPRRLFDLSRGTDGAIFVGEVIAGAVAGGIIGARLGQNTAQSVAYAFLGVPLGGAVFAIAAAAFLRFAPENIAMLALMAGIALGAGAAGVAVRAHWDAATAVVGVILGMQLGLLTLFLATIAVDNVSDDDTALIRMVAGNGTYAAAAVMWLLSSLRSPVDWSLLLFVPAIAMAAGAALALAIDVPARVTDFMIGVPMLASSFITLMVTFIVTDGFKKSLDTAGPAPAIVAVSTLGGFMLLSVFIAPKGDPTERAGRVSLAPFIAPTGGRSGGVSFGASAIGRF